ncbi:YnbE family lipoprotein [uncultured Erythrobacter sp.]|uniref:YnbE family lipoprotein n=1 Tax=uncultured Erythrobacter sp. TaxID=263913 RepID=UPI00260ECD3A|nr:YnbE family lipoprotein [uncultured Erythrobacter sp.]
MHENLAKAGLVMLSAAALSGCINVSAPEEPIVIELNVNIRAEVLYRLAEDASNTIDENADIF